MNNHGNYIVSLGNVCRWLATQGRGARRRDLSGLRRRRACSTTTRARSPASSPATWASSSDGTHGPGFAPGMALLGKYMLIGEGARGSLAKQLIAKYDLADGREPGKYGIGLKELWQVKPENHRPGLVQHSFGWPLDMQDRRRLVPLPFRRQPGGGRLRRPPQLQEPLSRRRSRNSSASRRIRRSAAPSRAPSASATARAPSPRAAGSRCRSCPSRAAR